MQRSRFLTVALSASLLFTMRAEARAQGSAQPGPWTGIGTSLFATGTDVWVKFFGADAGFTSQLLFVCDLSSSCQQLLFQNNNPSVVGQELQIAHTFTVGQEVIFKLFVLNTGDTWYTGDASRNSDGFAHFGTQSISAITTHANYTVLGGFEDLAGGGDADRNDLMFEFGNVAVTATPEPASLALFATGLVGVIGMVRRRRTSVA